MKTNPIYQVLVVTNPALLTAGQPLSALGVGQLAIMNYDTGTAVTAALPNRFYLAVGEGSGSLQGVRKSSGEVIRKALINSYSSKHPEAAANQVVTLNLTNFTAIRDVEYTIRMVFKSGHIMSQNGFTLPIKSFTVHIPVEGDPSAAYALGDFCDLIVAEVNRDPEGLVTAANVGDTSVTFTIHSEPKAVEVGGINPNYSFLRQLSASVSVSGGFEAGGYTLSSTGPTYAQGDGYDIRWEEFFAGGWNGEPGVYRTSDILQQFWGAVNLKADATKKYWVMRINYGIPSNSGGMLEYVNENETVVVIEDLFANKAFMDALNTLFAAVPILSTETTQKLS